MKVRDVMTRDVVTVGPKTPFRDIVEAMLLRGISGVPVVEDGKLIGVVSEADLAAKVAFPPGRGGGWLSVIADRLSGRAGQFDKARASCARELMSWPVVTASPDEPLAAVAKRMFDRNVKRLPVVEGTKLVGIIARRDLLPLFARADHSLEEEVRNILRTALFLPPEHVIDVDVKDGVAILSGQVYFRSDRRIVEAIVSALPGLIGIENRLEHRFEDAREAT